MGALVPLSPLTFGPLIGSVAVLTAYGLYLFGRGDWATLTMNVVAALCLAVSGSAMAMFVVLWKWR